MDRMSFVRPRAGGVKREVFAFCSVSGQNMSDIPSSSKEARTTIPVKDVVER